jgi:hypothetical protein
MTPMKERHIGVIDGTLLIKMRKNFRFYNQYKGKTDIIALSSSLNPSRAGRKFYSSPWTVEVGWG